MGPAEVWQDPSFFRRSRYGKRVFAHSLRCVLAHIAPSCLRLPSSPACPMFPAFVTRELVRGLDWLAAHLLPAPQAPIRQRIGRRGEEDAYFYLRSLGYILVARNYRSPRCRGEIDLIGWDQDVLCFVEVKTRTSRDVKTPEAAVDYHKRREVALTARAYLRSMPGSCQWRFDIVSVYCDGPGRPQFELFRNASLAA